MVEMNSFEKEFKREQEFQNTASSEAPLQFPNNQGQPLTGYPSYQQDNHPNRPSGGKPDFLDSLWQSVNHDLLIAKTFYFFFFSAFGSLFPLMGIFFKQLGMNPIQCGLLIGFRPLVEFLSAPFWGTIADRYQKGKQILLFSLVCWMVFTLTLCFIAPPAASCIFHNKTHHYLVNPEDVQGDIEKRSLHPVLPTWQNLDESPVDNITVKEGSSPFLIPVIHRDVIERSDGAAIEDGNDDNSTWNVGPVFPLERQKRKNKFPPGHVIGQSPGQVAHVINYNSTLHKSYVSPLFSTIVYRKDDVQNVFFLVLLLVVIGEFFSAPAITLADSVTLTYLGENANNYGKQRMFGSLGWGLAMFFVGIALDESTFFSNHPCGPHEREKNYTICFAVFSVLMGCAFIAATQFRFDYDALDDTIPMKSIPEDHDGKVILQSDLHVDGSAATIEPPLFPKDEQEPRAEKSTVFASKAKQIPEWLRVLRTFANLRYGAFLFVAWFMGLGVGLVFTFLFWHLQDLEGTPTLFGVASVINHISEIFAYFFSFRLIRQIGHVRVLCLGLLGNLARFLYVSWLTNPWWVLPFEFIQGVTHAAVWAACCSYITQATPMNLRSSAQGVLQGLHHGLGRGCGAVFGGLMATYCGTAVTFRAYGFICLIVLVAFIFINYYQPEHGFASAESVEPHQVLEESSHLAPHGVPSGPMPRALSSSRLDDLDKNGGGRPFQAYGTTEKQNGPFLDLPKPSEGSGWAANNADTTTGAWLNSAELTNALLTKKNSPLTSPQPKFDYDYIQEKFKAYNDVLNSHGHKDEDNDSNGNVQLLKAPPPKTVLHSLQPINRRCPSTYDW